MTRVKALIFLPLGLLLMSPAAFLGTLMLRGNVVSMDPKFGLLIVAMALGGLSGVIWSALALLRGR